MAIRILIFEDNERLRKLISDLLSLHDGFDVCAGFGDCNDAAGQVATWLPDVVIMDIDMPGSSGVDGVRMIKDCRPSTQIIMHTVFEDDDKLFHCICNGANGYILKKSDPEKLIDAVEEVVQGGSPMSPTIARKMLQLFKNGFRKTAPLTYALSAREVELLQLLVKGYSNKMIAAECFISLDTVKSHLKNIYAKLHVNCGKEAVAKALREKITD
ncbi:MAG: response regulator transcription factor [Chitinophagaceae bacterium]|nr:MAG: response regulator transcription factor [Chitinophagaceae bacterium]